MTIFEKSVTGRKAFRFPDTAVEKREFDIPNHLLRKKAPQLPELSEPDVVRHYTDLASKNYSVDKGFYPLGSCTMKYNPKINEYTAAHTVSVRYTLINLGNSLKVRSKSSLNSKSFCVR